MNLKLAKQDLERKLYNFLKKELQKFTNETQLCVKSIDCKFYSRKDVIGYYDPELYEVEVEITV